jgi:hypothetical protein
MANDRARIPAYATVVIGSRGEDGATAGLSRVGIAPAIAAPCAIRGGGHKADGVLADASRGRSINGALISES